MQNINLKIQCVEFSDIVLKFHVAAEHPSSHPPLPNIKKKLW